MVEPTQSQDEVRISVYEKLAEVAAALSAPARLKLVQLLSQSPRTVDELSAQSGQSVANTSQHLQKLAKCGVVVARRDGSRRIYRLRSESVALLWEGLQDLAEELIPDLSVFEDALTDRALSAPVAPDEILSKVKANKAILLDVRDPVESAATLVPGAKAIPLARLKAESASLPKSKTIFVYCRGRYCSLATEAVRQLRTFGFRAYRLRESTTALRRIQEAV